MLLCAWTQTNNHYQAMFSIKYVIVTTSNIRMLWYMLYIIILLALNNDGIIKKIEIDNNKFTLLILILVGNYNK
jgi:hypothetical protein